MSSSDPIDSVSEAPRSEAPGATPQPDSAVPVVADTPHLPASDPRPDAPPAMDVPVEAPSIIPSPLPEPAAAPAIVQLKDRFPNASAGKPYSVRLPDVWGDDAQHVLIGAVTVPPETGLTYDAIAARLHGMPATPGEYDLLVALRLAGNHQRPEVERKFRLTINPDPRSLWKVLPSDPGLIFAKPDDTSSALDTPELRWLGASRRGRSHAHEAKPRDDDYRFHRLDNGWHIVIASDGAGSARYSRRGSQLACEVTLKFLSERLGDGLDASVSAWLSLSAEDSWVRLKNDLYATLPGAALQTQKALAAEAAQHGAVTKDFNATYIVVIAKQFDEDWLVASFAIGDGGAGLIDGTGRLRLLSTPDGGEFAGQTVFVTMPGVFQDAAAIMRRIHCCRVTSLKMIALMTDGVTDPKFETDANYENPDKWQPLHGEILAAVADTADSPTAAANLLKWLDFWSPGNHDDRTIVVGLPRTQHARYQVT